MIDIFDSMKRKVLRKDSPLGMTTHNITRTWLSCLVNFVQKFLYIIYKTH